MFNWLVFPFCFGCLAVAVIWLVDFWLGWSQATNIVGCWLVSVLFVGSACCWLLVVCAFDWRIIGSWLSSLLVAALVGWWLLVWLSGVCWLLFGLVG